MMGLVILGVLVVYLIVSIWVTKKAVSWAKANNKKPWVWGGLAAFVMYNLVFWDLIPTLVMHKYYCDTQTGFWVYKTPEQWMRENPRMKEGVGSQEQITADRKVDKLENGFRETVSVNQRTKIKYIFTVVSAIPIFDLSKHEEALLDSSKNFVLAKRVFFAAGHWGGAPKNCLTIDFGQITPNVMDLMVMLPENNGELQIQFM